MGLTSQRIFAIQIKKMKTEILVEKWAKDVNGIIEEETLTAVHI